MTLRSITDPMGKRRRLGRLGRLGLLGLLAGALAGCVTTAPPFDDPGSEYTQRSLTISPTAGNAQVANTVMQTAGPWPAYSYDTNVPGDGVSMVKAVNRFENREPPAQSSTGGTTARRQAQSHGAATQ